MKWNKFPEVLPPEDKIVVVLMLSHSYITQDNVNETVLSPVLGRWNYSYGWKTYKDKKLHRPNPPLYWCEILDITPEIIDSYSKFYGISVDKKFSFYE